MAKSTKLLRPPQIYGPGNPIPLGRTKFYQDIVHHEGGDEFIPGTEIRRLRLVNITARAKGGFEDEVFAIVEGLRAARDAKSSTRVSVQTPRGRRCPT